MNKVRKPIFQEEDLGVNPFLTNLNIPTVTRKLINTFIVNDGNQEQADLELEYTSYTKLFCSADRRYKTNQLSPRAKELLLWMMYQIKNADDYIWINKKLYMEENNITSINTYKEAIKDLITKGFLVLTIKTDVFWINPDMFFKGDRIRKYPNNVNGKYNY